MAACCLADGRVLGNEPNFMNRLTDNDRNFGPFTLGQWRNRFGITLSSGDVKAALVTASGERVEIDNPTHIIFDIPEEGETIETFTIHTIGGPLVIAGDVNIMVSGSAHPDSVTINGNVTIARADSARLLAARQRERMTYALS